MHAAVQCAIKEGNFEAAQELAERIKTNYLNDAMNNPKVKAALSLLELSTASQSGGQSESVESLAQKVKENPDDMVRYALRLSSSVDASHYRFNDIFFFQFLGNATVLGCETFLEWKAARFYQRVD
jgi:hypothetical protein